ncbi:hypothetical protein BCR33DRAFT_661778, partial [Rhizoclosmatium globosum]
KGNPALSQTVKDYMAGLRRHKISKGDISASVRAITSQDLRKIHEYLTSDAERIVLHRTNSTETRHGLGDALSSELYLGCLLGFLCLLRCEEFLELQMENIRLSFEMDSFRLEVCLVTRKTHQEGGIKPYYLWMDNFDRHLCAVSAYLRWISFVGAETAGHLFKTVASDNQTLKSTKMARGTFISFFKNVLKDVGLEWSLYGTHSFRRGGTQYLLNERRWGLSAICEWGGWSLDYDNMTIVRYLHGLYDVVPIPREQLMNKAFKYLDKCVSCGRDCNCGPQYSKRGTNPYSRQH